MQLPSLFGMLMFVPLRFAPYTYDKIDFTSCRRLRTNSLALRKNLSFYIKIGLIVCNFSVSKSELIKHINRFIGCIAYKRRNCNILDLRSETVKKLNRISP